MLNEAIGRRIFLHELCSQRSKTFWSVDSEGLFLHSVLKTVLEYKKLIS
jgi:hypothetical protein